MTIERGEAALRILERLVVAPLPVDPITAPAVGSMVKTSVRLADALMHELEATKPVDIPEFYRSEAVQVLKIAKERGFRSAELLPGLTESEMKEVMDHLFRNELVYRRNEKEACSLLTNTSYHPLVRGLRWLEEQEEQE